MNTTTIGLFADTNKERGEKQSKNTVRVYMKNNQDIPGFWVPKFEEMEKILKLKAENEDEKYNAKNNPNVLGKKMMFIKYIYPIWKEYLDINGLILPIKDLKETKKWGDKRK